jgi:hypothetical protein
LLITLLKKKHVALCLLTLGLMFSGINCGISPKIDDKGEVVYWGTKAECVSFLQGPDAKAERWLLEALR